MKTKKQMMMDKKNMQTKKHTQAKQMQSPNKSKSLTQTNPKNVTPL